MYQLITADLNLPFEITEWEHNLLNAEEKRKYMKINKQPNETSPADSMFQASLTPAFEIQTDPVVSSRGDSFEFGGGSFGGGGASGNWDAPSSNDNSPSYDSGSYDSGGDSGGGDCGGGGGD